MSEYSDSIHVYCTDLKYLSQKLRAIEACSFIISKNVYPIPILVIGEAMYDHNGSLKIDLNNLLWIQYYFGEDEGAYLIFNFGNKEIGKLTIGKRMAEKEISELRISTVSILEGYDALEKGNARLLDQLNQSNSLIENCELICRIFNVTNYRNVCSRDLLYNKKRLLEFYPNGLLINKSKGAIPNDNNHSPNQWCNMEKAPSFMYLEVPVFDYSDEDAMWSNLYSKYWRDNEDWDEKGQKGFWLYQYFMDNLPSLYKYLANRIMNAYMFDDLGQTMISIAHLLGPLNKDPYVLKEGKAPVRL